jgi:hypothetical protein
MMSEAIITVSEARLKKFNFYPLKMSDSNSFINSSDKQLIGILAIQGAVEEHVVCMKKLGCNTREVSTVTERHILSLRHSLQYRDNV